MMVRILARMSPLLGGAAIVTGLWSSPCLAVPTDTILFHENGNGTITELFNGSFFGTCFNESAGCFTTSEQGGGTGIPTFGASSFPININIFEDPAHKVLGDTFSLAVQDFSGSGGTANTVVADFVSVGNTPLTPLSGGTVIDLLETGGVQDLGTVTFNDANGSPIDAIDYQFVSDVSEPSSLMLQGVGLMVLFGLGRRATSWQRCGSIAAPFASSRPEPRR